MRGIRMEKDIILYYGNAAGYVSGGKAVVDPLFESQELKDFLARQKDVSEVKWTDGVFPPHERAKGKPGNHSAEELPHLAAQAGIGYPDAFYWLR